MTLRRCRLGVLLILTVFAAACSSSHSATLKPNLRKPATDFSLKDADGRTVKLSDYKGKVVLLDFWATWCGPCKIEEPWFIEFEQTYKDRGFAILGISMDEEGWSVVKPYVEKRKINFRVLLATEEIDRLYPGMEAWPTTFLIDRSGKIAEKHVGVVSKKVFQDSIAKLLEEKP